MSEHYKLKYEVVAILKDNIEKGLQAFGLPITQNPGDGGWLVVESDQPAFRGAEHGVLFFMERAERIGWQSARHLYDKERDTFDEVEYFIEQQTWKIRVISKRTTVPITDENIPISTDDVTSMLISWFNRKGCKEFRNHNMANLFVQQKDVNTYQGKSDVPQWVTEFPLRLQVVKQFETEIGWATPKYGGSFGLEGNAGESDGRRGWLGTRLVGGIKNLIRGIFTDRH
jgi:hypothetical protein